MRHQIQPPASTLCGALPWHGPGGASSFYDEISCTEQAETLQVGKRSLRREQVQLEGKLPTLPSAIVREQISIENELFETISYSGQPVRRNDHCIPMSSFITFYE